MNFFMMLTLWSTVLDPCYEAARVRDATQLFPRGLLSFASSHRRRIFINCTHPRVSISANPVRLPSFSLLAFGSNLISTPNEFSAKTSNAEQR